MTRVASPKLAGYAWLTALGVAAGLAAGRWQLVALAAPFAFALVVGLASAREPRLAADMRLDRDRVLEGDAVGARVSVRSSTPIDRLDVALVLPDGVEGDDDAVLAASAPAGETIELEAQLVCRRFGAYQLGELALRAEDRFGFVVFERAGGGRAPLRVLPAPEHLRSLVRPRETQLVAGDGVARRRGEGIEFADLRPFVHGDRVRDVNWRASARRAQLVVNERHPERATTIVVFLDSFAHAGAGGHGTLGMAVRAAAALAEHYLARRDRVGLVSFGGTLRWLTPSAGLVQGYRIVDALLETDIVLSYAWKGIDVLPPRTLPPEALVVALSPLLDERTVAALLDLRGRGFDLAVLEVSPLPFVERPEGAEDELALRLWRLVRDSLHVRFEQLGVPVVEWREGAPLLEPLEEVRAFRRYARQVHAR